MEIPSLRPEVGLELFKLILLRESYLKRLEKKLQQMKGLIDLSLVGMIDLLRESTLQVVEMIDTWEKTQLAYPEVQPFKWNGENYMHKIMHDTNWLEDYPQLTLWLGFSLINNPFIVPMEVLSPYLMLHKDALIIFGKYSEELDKRKVSKVMAKPLKSPYTTPIINDPEVFAHLSAKNKLDKKFKNVGQGIGKSSGPDALISQESTEVPSNPYQCYLSFDLIQKIKKCWNKLNGGKLLLPVVDKVMVESISESEYEVHGNSISFAEDPHVISNGKLHESSGEILGTSFLEQSTLRSRDADWHGGSSGGFVEESTSPSHNVMDINKDPDFVKRKEGFYNSLFGPSEHVFRKAESMNESHRLSKFVETHSISSKNVQHPFSLQHSQLWTPHEINLQRKVQRRGGELFVLTAAGVKGRLKAPWRKNRFERMEYDIGHLKMLRDQFEMTAEDQRSSALRLLMDKTKENEKLEYGKKKGKMVRIDPSTMEKKLKAIQQRIADKLEAKSDVEIREKFLTEQYNYFKKVSEHGSLTDVEKQRQRHRLGEGETREQDQQISMKVEDTMARKIQALIRRAFGRALRKAEIARRNKAAIVIQCQWRSLKVSRNARLRSQQLRLATMVQRAYRLYKAGIFRRQLQLEALQRFSATFIQRVYRGYRGRRRLGLKRDLIKSIHAASDAVSLVNLKPGDIEELAAAIEDYTRDYSIQIPLAVLTVLRGILYLFNGDGSECVIVSTDEGYTEKKFIYAANASWQGVKLILRRKGRFLRRLRSLIKNSLLPNPSRIVMTQDCETHVHAIRDHVKLEDFKDIKKARHCLTQLYVYISNVIRAYDLQTLFPEYFEPGLPFWFRNMMRIREAYDRADIIRRIESKAHSRIEEVKRMHCREGKKFGHISVVINRNKKELEEAREHLHKMKARFKVCMDDLTSSEQKELTTLEAIVRAKGLAKNVSEGDLKEYLRATLIPDENYLKELQYNVDAKGITHLQAQTDLILAKERVERNNTFRDFDKIFKFKELHTICAELGKIKADLLILLEAWNNLLRDIGGYQYIKDLMGENMNKYEVIRDTTIRLLRLRKEFQEKLEKELKSQYNKVYYIINQSNLKFVDKRWDTPTEVEVEFEENENRECCKRDYETEFRKRRQLESLELNSKFPWTPLVLFVDIKLPREFISLISSSLKNEFNFHVQDWQALVRRSKDFIGEESKDTHGIDERSSSKSPMHTVQEELQAMIDAKQNILLLANRGFHYAAKITFDNYVQAVMNVLVPKPRVLYLSAENSFSTDLWLEQSSIQRNYLYEADGIEIDYSQYDLMLGKIRKLGSHFYRLLQVFPKFIGSVADSTRPSNMSQIERKKEMYHGHLPSFFQAQFAMDFQSFLFSIKNNLQLIRNKRIEKLELEELQKREATEKKKQAVPTKSMKSPIVQSRKNLNQGDSGPSQLNRSSSAKITQSRPGSAIQTSIPSNPSSAMSSRPVSALNGGTKPSFSWSPSLPEVNVPDKIFDDLPFETLMDFLLAMNLSIIWGLYNAPISKWTHKDIYEGVKAFREYLGTVTLEQVSKRFEAFTTLSPHHVDKLSNAYRNLDEVVFLQAQLKQNKEYKDVWDKCRTFDFHKNPARALMTSWLTAVMEYIIMTPAMVVNEMAAILPYDHICKPTYDEVVTVIVSNEARNAMIGDIMHLLLAPTIVHENPSPVWKLFYDRDCMDSMESQSLGTQIFKNSIKSSKHRAVDAHHMLDHTEDDQSAKSTVSQGSATGHGTIQDSSQLSKVVVYHHGDEILIELQINLTPESVALLDEKAIEVLQSVGLLPRPPKKKQSRKNKVKIRASTVGDGTMTDGGAARLQTQLNHPQDNNANKEKFVWKQNKCFRFFGRMFNQDLVLLIQPNYTEIFEGNIQKPLSQLITESELGYATKENNAAMDEYEEAHRRNHGLEAPAFDREQGYYKCISNWTCVDSVAGKLSVSTIRARYLILSKLGNIAGHYVRLEIYEERYGEIRIMMFGLSENELTGEEDDFDPYAYSNSMVSSDEKPEKIIFQFRINRAVIFQMLSYCDEILEKDRLDQSDTLAMSYIFSDRLTIEPSYNWYQFVSHQSFLPYTLRTKKRGSDHHQHDIDESNTMFRLKLRLRGGPGRLVGRKLLNLKTLYFKEKIDENHQENDNRQNDLYSKSKPTLDVCDDDDALLEQMSNEKHKFLVLLSIFEVNSENNAHELRIVLYHFYDSQTAEYRISAMERVILFKDEEALFAQLLKRLRMVYCDYKNTAGQPYVRTFLALPELGNRKDLESVLNVREYEVDGDDEYELCSVMDGGDDDEDTDIKENSLADSMDSASVDKHKKKTLNTDDVEESGWGWAMYFDRSPLSEVRGNLVISVVMIVAKRGFLFTVYDPRTFREAHRFVYFHESLPFFQNKKTIADLEEELGNLDESIAFDIIDELFLAVEVIDSDGDGLLIVLQNDKTAKVGHESEEENSNPNMGEAFKPSEAIADITIAKVRELPRSRPAHPMARKKDGQVTYRITIEVFKAKDLARIGIYGVRNAVAIVKFNMREIGRTGIVKGTIHPDWESLSQSITFDIHVNKQSSLDTCTIEVEVFDTDANGKLTDFLGLVKFSGESLKSFLYQEALDLDGTGVDKFPKWFDLAPSKKLTDQENKNVAGKIELRGVQRIIGDALLKERMKQRELLAKDPDRIRRMQEEADLKARSEITPLSIAPSAIKSINTPALSSIATVRPDLVGERALQAYKFFDLYLKELDLTKIRIQHHRTVANPTHPSSGGDSLIPITKDAEFFIKISLNQLEVYRHVMNFQRIVKRFNHLTTNYDPSNIVKETVEDFTTQPLRFDDLPPIECRVPMLMPFGLCCLTIEIFYHLPSIKENPSNNIGNVILVGQLNLKGNALKEFIRKSLIAETSTNKQSESHSNAIGKPHTFFFGNKKQHLKKGGSTEHFNVSGDIKLSMMTSLGLRPVYRCYRLQVLSARGLPRADMFGKSDPYVRVFFNDKLLGQTNYIKNTLNPSFTNQNEEFFLMIPIFQKIDSCKLEVQIIDHDNMSQGDLLGVHILTGSVLFRFLHSNPTQSLNPSNKNTQSQSINEMTEYWKTQKCEYNNKAKSVFFPLMKSQLIPTDLDQVSDVKGDIELKVSAIDPFNQSSNVAMTGSTIGLLGSGGKDSKGKDNKFPFMSSGEQTNFVVPHKLGSYPSLMDSHNKKVELLSKELNTTWWEKELLEQLPHRLEREIHYLPISTFVLTIHAAKGLANADLFGKSDPFVRVLWNGVEIGTTTTIDDTLDPIWNEEFTLSTAPGQGIECCVLELEVYDRDNLKEGDFLGSLMICGSSLKELSKACLSNNGHVKKAAGMKSYHLQKSSTKTEKENKLVKGLLHISLKPVIAGSSRGLLIDDDETDDSKDFRVEVEGTPDQESIAVVKEESGAKFVAAPVEKPEILSSAIQVFPVAIEEPSSQIQKYHTSMEISISSISSSVGASFSPDVVNALNCTGSPSILEAHVWFNGAIWYTLEGRYDPSTKQIMWRRWEDQGASAIASVIAKGGSKWTTATKSLVNQDVQKLTFSVSTKITMEDHFLFVSVYHHAVEKHKSRDLSILERSTRLVGGLFLTGSVLMDFMKITPQVLVSNQSSTKLWHSVVLQTLPCLASHPDVRDFRGYGHHVLPHQEDGLHQHEIHIPGQVQIAMRLVKEANLEDVIFLGTETSFKACRRISDDRLVRISTDLPDDRIPWKFKFRKLHPLRAVKSQFSGSSARSGTSGSNPQAAGDRDFDDEIDAQHVDEMNEGDEPDDQPDDDGPVSSRVPLDFSSTPGGGDSGAKLPIHSAASALVHGRSRNGVVETNENKRSTNILIQSRTKREIASTNPKDIFKKDLMGAKAKAKANADVNANTVDSIKPLTTADITKSDEPLNGTKQEEPRTVDANGVVAGEGDPLFEIKKFQLELAAMNFTLTLQSKLEEENRVYWRGKVTPKNITFANEDMKHVVFATRSSRLLKNKDIDDLEVISEVHYVKEFGDAVPDMEKQASLPVCVKEIVSCGPGLVTRTFRIEMLTNTNILLGTTEVADNVKDFYRAVGVDAVAKIINKNSGSMLPIQEWDFTRIFEHIVEDRLEINMLGSSSSKKQTSTNEESQIQPTVPPAPAQEPIDSVDGMAAKRRKKAIFQANNPSTVTDFSSSSVITIHRDSEEVVDEFLMQGRLGLEAVAEEDEYEEEDDRAEIHSTSAESFGEESASGDEDAFEGEEEEEEDEPEIDQDGQDDGETSATPYESEQEMTGAREKVKIEGDVEQERAKRREKGKEYRKKKQKQHHRNKQHPHHPHDAFSSSQSLVSSTSSKFKLHNLRLHSHTKRLTGKQFSCVVLLSSETERLLTDRPDYFFHKVFPDFTAFQPEYNSGLKLLFRCLDCQANKLHIITLPATFLWETEWLPGDFQFPDLSSKFRRDKLGARLLSYLSLRFLPGGECVLEVKIKKQTSSLNRDDELNKIEDIPPDAPEQETAEEVPVEVTPAVEPDEDEDDFLFDNVDDDREDDHNDDEEE